MIWLPIRLVKKRDPIVTELIIRGRRLNFPLVFITQCLVFVLGIILL